MKNLFVFILMLLLFGCTPENPTPNPTFTIGQSYQGGKIAYIDDSGLHGLIAAPSDLSTSAKWGHSNIEILGADGLGIVTGAQNTIDILNGCSDAGIAARLCGDLVLGGYSDWYLPEKLGLNQLYLNRFAIGGFVTSGFSNNYWSSSEFDFSSAWGQNFTNGNQDNYGKGGGHYVRAVRSF